MADFALYVNHFQLFGGIIYRYILERNVFKFENSFKQGFTTMLKQQDSLKSYFYGIFMFNIP